jgi:hypothetical protein
MFKIQITFPLSQTASVAKSGAMQRELRKLQAGRQGAAQLYPAASAIRHAVSILEI